MEFMVLVRGGGKIKNIVGIENSKCKVFGVFVFYFFNYLVKILLF